MRSVLGAAASLAALCACAMAALPAGQPGVTLRYRFRAGATTRYKVSINVQSGGSAGMTVTGTSDLKVARVNADGSAQIVSTQSRSLSGFLGGGRGSMSASYTLTPLGQMRNARVSGAGKAPQMMGALLDPRALSLMIAQLPPRPVRQGDTWTASAVAPFKGSKPLTVRYRLFKVERTPGAVYAQLRQSYTLPVNQVAQLGAQDVRLSGKVDIGAAIRFNVSAGLVEDTTATGTGTVQTRVVGSGNPAESGDLSFTTHMERMK